MPNLRRYIVQQGDSLSAIAKKFATTISAIQLANGMSSANINIGQAIWIPVAATPPAPTTPIVTPPKPTVKPPAPAPVVPPKPTPKPPTPTPKPVITPPKPTPVVTPPPPKSVPPVVTPTFPGGFNTVTPTEAIKAARRQYQVLSKERGTTGINDYALTIPRPQGGAPIIAKFRDKVNSIYMVYPNGISFPGNYIPDIPLALFQTLGMSATLAKALQFVSKHEGSFDAINSFDKAIFSFGFIQFVGAQAHGNSLGKVLAYSKLNAPDLFAKYFQAVGIDVSFAVKDGGVIAPVTVSVLNPDLGIKLIGDDAYKYIQQNIDLHGVFIQSAYEPMFVREQLRVAALDYVFPALNLKFNLNIGGTKIQIPFAKDIFQSEAAVTMLIDLCVNRGSGGANTVLSLAIAEVAKNNGLLDAIAMRGIDERAVADALLAQNPTEKRIVDRVGNIISSGLSFAKG